MNVSQSLQLTNTIIITGGEYVIGLGLEFSLGDPMCLFSRIKSACDEVGVHVALRWGC